MKNSHLVGAVCACITILYLPAYAQAGTVSAYYGDDDGFGVGATSGIINPDVNNQGPGEAFLTDMRLISSGPFICTLPDGTCGPFNPTGNFNSISVSNAITSVTLTLRTGSFDSSVALDAPNRIYLDGLLVDPLFINGFSSANTDNVETRSINLNPSFYPVISDGMVSLAGTHISEASGSGSFQVDFLRLDVAVVPIPAAIWLFGSGLLGLIGISRRKKVA